MRNHSKKSTGFSLVLSLTIMAGIVMLVVSLAAFTSIESRLAMQHQLYTRAKLNAIASMRLALGHLQQEAGPDRRATARGDITQPAATAATVLNPMWTGVWRTDLPDLPPAWLVSGRADQVAGLQSASLFSASGTGDYPLGYWAPWQNSTVLSPATLVPLVGIKTASPANDGVPSGLVSLPKITLPDDNINGGYAYWIGDEGVKARINLHDTRATSTDQADQLLALRSPLAQGFLRGLPNPQQWTALSKLDQFSFFPGLDQVLQVIPGIDSSTTALTLDYRNYFHDLSCVSAGVIADSLNGGLKRDLSTAFELSDAKFAQTEFGGGATGAAGTQTETGFKPTLMPVLQNGNNPVMAAPIFNRTVSAGEVRGPAWWTLRDFHRLYKNVGWTAATGSGQRSMGIPSLRGRPLWPNVSAAHPSGPPSSTGLANNSLRNRIYGYSDIYDGDQPSGSLNPNAYDYIGGNSNSLVTRPLNVAANPYVQRVTLAFSVNKMQWFVWKSIKIGKNVMWYQEEWVDIRLNLTPIVVIHNPYNVRMTWQPGNDPGNSSRKPYAAAISFAELNDWQFRFTQYDRAGGVAGSWSTSIEKFFNIQSPDSTDDDTFRLYLETSANNQTITLEPGEHRVFSCQPVYGDWTKSIVLDNTFSALGGYRDTIWDWGFGNNADGTPAEDSFDIAAPISFAIVPGGKMRMRHAVTTWPTDQLVLNKFASSSPGNDKNDFFYNSSEASEVVFTDINPARYPTPAAKWFPSWRDVRDKYQRPNSQADGRIPYPTPTSPIIEPDLVAVIDVTTKTAAEAAAPFPTFTHSNPLAPTQRSSASGRIGSGTGMGAKGTSPSYQLALRTVSWMNVVPNTNNGQLAFGGFNTSPWGNSSVSPRVIFSEIPLTQPTSLAQYAHANFGVRDQQPLLSIGNSFASPLIQATKTLQSNGSNWTEYDQSYLLNTALWDSFYLSSLAPWMNTGKYGAVTAAAPAPSDLIASPTRVTPADPNERKSLTTVISDFVNLGTPLDNPRFTLAALPTDTAATAAALADYRRSAAVLLNQGAFNVNSTSVLAWQAFLSTAKNFAVANVVAAEPKNDANTRFPRTMTTGSSSVATGGVESSSNWSGFANLSDAQIASLATAIVAENKARFSVSARSERDLIKPPLPRLFGGLTAPATPYLGLSEFINRFLTSQDWANRCGALQAAILRTDQTGGTGLSDRFYSSNGQGKVTQASLNTPSAGFYPHPENIEVAAQSGPSRTHTAMAAPGNLLQSDLLQSLGSALATRSDTFTIRCYGEAIQASGETGSAWLEIVVQRIPEFLDPVNPAETGNSAPRPLLPAPSAETDSTVSTALTAVNNLLGRRFKPVSMRWLKPNEI